MHHPQPYFGMGIFNMTPIRFALQLQSIQIMTFFKLSVTTIFCLLILSISAQQEIEFRSDGIVVPRTTPDSVSNPVEGMLIYDSATDGFKYFDGTVWLNVGGGSGGSVSWTDVTGKPAGFADDTDNVDDADASATNELQSISKSGNTVTLSNGGGSFTDEMDDADSDPNNELQTITKSGNVVSLSDMGGSFTDEVDDADADPTNGLQTLSKLGNTVTMSNGGGSFTDEVDDADDDPNNEIQKLVNSGGNLSLSLSGVFVPLSDISPWTINNSIAHKEIGKVGIGNTNPSARLDIISDATEDGLRVRIDGATKLRVRSNGGVNIGGNPSVVPDNGLYVSGFTGLGTTTPSERLEISGALLLKGNASSNNPEAGTIRWNSSTVDFEGFDGTHWESLTGLPGPQPPPVYQVGDYEDEGVVFYVSPDGKTVKFIYLAELGRDDWTFNGTIEIDGADSNFDGLQNSLDIVNDPDIPNNSSAAQLCLDLVAGGKTDWYLPAYNEVLELYSVRDVVGDTIAAYLGDSEIWDANNINLPWTSTEFSATDVKVVFFNGIESIRDKNTHSIIRAVRTVTFP